LRNQRTEEGEGGKTKEEGRRRAEDRSQRMEVRGQKPGIGRIEVEKMRKKFYLKRMDDCFRQG